MGVECWLMCVVRRMFGAQVCSVVRWLSGCGLVDLLAVLIVPLFLSFLMMPGICCFLQVTHTCIGGVTDSGTGIGLVLLDWRTSLVRVALATHADFSEEI
jgi:hypothetical protein